MDQKIIALYDEYTHAPLPRRVFLTRLAKIAGGTAAAYALLPVLENRYAQAAIVAEDDSRIVTSMTTYPVDAGEMKAYMAKPATGSSFPSVIVIHENRGLNPHIRDITRRFAVEGYMALAVDALTPLGGTPEDEDKAREMIGKLNMDVTLQSYMSAVDFLSDHPEGNAMVASVGFCWGGGMSAKLAVNSENLDGAVVYYGSAPPGNEVSSITGSLLLHYAGLDERINAGIPEFEAALKKARIKYQLHMYEGVNHAFNNDTNAARYNKEAADLAWARTLDFMKVRLATA